MTKRIALRPYAHLYVVLAALAPATCDQPPADPAGATTAATSQLEACEVVVSKELMITDLSVVNDPIRTTFTAPSSDPRRGVFTFAHLMRNLATTPAAAPDLVEGILVSIRDGATVNGMFVNARGGVGPITTNQWAQGWHALGALPFPSESYNDALQTLVARFTARGVMPARPNGSALSQLRTNEIAFDTSPGGTTNWQLREFVLAASDALVPTTDKQTPDQMFNAFLAWNEAPTPFAWTKPATA